MPDYFRHSIGNYYVLTSLVNLKALGLIVFNFFTFFTLTSWASHTLACFPQPLQQFYAQNPCPHETKQELRQRVEDEYRRWKSKL